MASSLKYAVGATLVNRQDDALTAEVVEMKLFNGIEHYRIRVRPAHIHTTSIWLSGFGLDREFARLERTNPASGHDESPLRRAMSRLIRGEATWRRRAA